MSKIQEIERDLREYLEKEPNLLRQDRLSYLLAIFAKRMEFNKLDHNLTYKDVFRIIDGAKSHFVNMKTPITVSNKKLEPSENANIALLESFIGYMNSQSLLKKNIKFDYTE